MPGVWVADVLTLLNIIQHSGVTPHAWHIDLMHYVYKGGEDSSLPNHRPLTLVDVLRKVFSSVSTSRMRRDWTRLRIFDTCNPGFGPGRSTVNAIYPLRMAAEQCLADEEELVAFLDDLKCCFDMPAQVVIELALLRLAWHMFTCTLPEETNVRRRWLQAVRRDVAKYVKDAAVARIIVRCWSHTSDGHIAAARLDEKQRWRAPSMRWKGGAWRFDDVIPRTHDASGFDSDDDDGAPNRRQGSTSSITQSDRDDVDWDDIDGAQSPAVEAARLLYTARQMVDTPRWWLTR